MMDPREDDPKGSLIKLMPVEKNKFKAVPENLTYGEIGEFVSFELGADGKAVRIKVGENYRRSFPSRRESSSTPSSDNPAASRDSLEFGPVSRDKIDGRVVWRYWPLSRLGPIR